MTSAASPSGSVPPDREANGYTVYPLGPLRGGSIHLPGENQQMGLIMAELKAPPGVAPAGDDVSPARLHGEACWSCGAVTKGLTTAGSVYTQAESEIRIWPIVACPPHQAQVIAMTTPRGGWPAAPVPVPGCNDCSQLDRSRQRAVTEADAGREADVRVLMRRHLRLDHADV